MISPTMSLDRVAGVVERRQALRYPITLPVDLEGATGITRDVSTSGLYFETNQVFSTGAPIRLTLVLGQTCPGTPICLHCQGQIVRTDRREEETGVAVVFESFRFGPASQKWGKSGGARLPEVLEAS